MQVHVVGGPRVPEPARPLRQARGAPPVQVAVGHQCPHPGHAQLPAVGVAGQDQVDVVGRHRLQDPPVGGVREPQPQSPALVVADRRQGGGRLR